MKKYILKIEGKHFEVEVKSCSQNSAVVSVNGKTYDVAITGNSLSPQATANAPVTSTIGSKPKASVGILKASLPGSIFKINVKEGDVVKKGQVLLIMEAMKMENNVFAECDGVVKSISVKVGDAVLQEDELLEIE